MCLEITLFVFYRSKIYTHPNMSEVKRLRSKIPLKNINIVRIILLNEEEYLRHV